MERYFRWMTRQRRTVVALAAAVVAGAAVAARDLQTDYSVEQFFPPSGEARAVFDEYRKIFPGEDAQVVFLLETPEGLDRTSYRVLEGVAAAFDEAGVAEVWWAGRLMPQAHGAGGTHGSPRDNPLRDHPLFSGFLWNGDGTVHTVQGVLPPELNDDASRRRIASRLEATIEGLEVERRWSLSGTPMLRAQVPELLEVDQTVLLGGGIALFFVVLYAFVGHAGRALLSLAAVLPAYVVTLAVMALLGKPVTIMTSFIPIVILVVGVCDSTHLLTHWSRHRAAGSAPPEAAAVTFGELASSCFFTSLTTALGFLSLVATGIGVIADFGAFTALAVMTTFAFTMTLLPALLAFGRPGAHRPAPEWVSRVVPPLVRGARGVAARRARTPLLVFGVVSVVCLLGAGRIAIDTYLVDDLDEDTRVMQDRRWLEGSGFALFQTNVFLRAGADELTEPAMLDWMERFQRAVEGEPIVAATLALPDLVGTGARTEALPLPDATLEGMARGVYRPDAGAAQVVVVVEDAGSRVTLPFLDRMEARLAADPPPFGTARVTGTVVMAHTFSSRILRSFGPSIVLGLALIWLVMTGLFRSARLGLVALVPNLFPLVVLVGVMAVLGVPLKPSSILVFSIAFGIAVDDSIHIMGRFTHLRRSGSGRRRALIGALRDTGPALVMSTVVVSAGFSLLLLSRFELLQLVGLLTATTAVAALLADLYLFPALLHLVPAPASGPDEPSRGRKA